MDPKIEKILFQRDGLIVSQAKIVAGNATIFYPSISATRIYEGRPLLKLGIAGVVGIVMYTVMTLEIGRLFGNSSPAGFKAGALMLLPLAGMAFFGFWYKVKCLLVSIDGSSPVTVLRSKERRDLLEAQQAIEEAKSAYPSRPR